MSTNLNKKNRDNYFMSLALKQAMINLGNTKENPSVGCIIKTTIAINFFSYINIIAVKIIKIKT